MSGRFGKKTKYFWLIGGVLLAFLLMLAGVFLAKISGKARFYQPVALTLATDSVSALSGSVYGETMFGRKLDFEHNDTSWTLGAGFLRGVVIGASDSLWKRNDLLTISSGTDTWVFKMQDIAATWEVHHAREGKTFYSVPDELRSSGSVFSFFVSVFRWKTGQYLLFAIAGLIIVFLLVFLFKDYMPEGIKRSYYFWWLSAILFLGLSGFLYDQLSGFLRLHITIGLIAVIWFYGFLAAFLFMLFRRNRRKFQNFFTSLTVLFILILIAEVALRFTDMRTYSEKNEGVYKSPYAPENTAWYKVRQPNTVVDLTTKEYSFLRKTNSLGLSDIEPQLEKDSNEFLILGIGDSFTEGDGTAADSTWLKFLEYDLRYYKSRPTRFINAGVCGSDPFYEYVLLRDKLLVYQADLVIVALGYDLDDIIFRGGMERFQPNGTVIFKQAPWWEKFYALSYIFRLCAHNLLGADHLLLTSGKYQMAVNEAKQQLIKSIDLFDELAVKEKFQLLFVCYPMKGEVINKKYIYWDDILFYMESKGINHVDLLDYYLNEGGMNNDNICDYYWLRDGHHKSAGYKIFAEGVEDKLTVMGKSDSLKYSSGK